MPVISYDYFPSAHKFFVLNVDLIDEPKHYNEVVRFLEWRKVMLLELEALETNQTWTVVLLSRENHAIGCICVYKVKYKSDGTIEKDIKLGWWPRVLLNNVVLIMLKLSVQRLK